MHLEFQIGLCLAPLYDFNGKALWGHVPLEISTMKYMWWLEMNGCFLFHVVLVFGLLCRAGFPIITQALSQESNLGFPHSNKNIPGKKKERPNHKKIFWHELEEKSDHEVFFFILGSRNCFTWIYCLLFICMKTVTQLHKRWSYILCLHNEVCFLNQLE